jgi:hypothetical protein
VDCFAAHPTKLKKKHTHTHTHTAESAFRRTWHEQFTKEYHESAALDCNNWKHILEFMMNTVRVQHSCVHNIRVIDLLPQPLLQRLQLTFAYTSFGILIPGYKFAIFCGRLYVTMTTKMTRPALDANLYTLLAYGTTLCLSRPEVAAVPSGLRPTPIIIIIIIIIIGVWGT